VSVSYRFRLLDHEDVEIWQRCLEITRDPYVQAGTIIYLAYGSSKIPALGGIGG
jgi:hypothetical protein